LERLSLRTPKGKPQDALGKLAKAASELLATSGAPKRRLAAAGVCLPGLVEKRTGRCVLAPNLGWTDVAVAEIVSEALGVPTFVMNTADASVVVESTEGAAVGARNVVLLYVGRGVGAGILSDGTLLHGAEGFAGEIGHCRFPELDQRCRCGRTGCLETATDGPAITRAAQARGLDVRSAVEVSRAADAGDPVALQILGDAGAMLGIAASWLINLFDPEVLLVGGGVASAGAPLIEPLKQRALALCLPHLASRVDIRPWTTGRDAGVRGAVLVAMQRSESFYRVIFQE
jgi:predicted NBD/HSP70 family sugar kinase